ncbi:DUF3703 domain-containing protein [Kangiella shandongensis]|uniref:DUF3703 domain-containing protein n=1 Tax=Kangiella shandongensis TaxID=2763258 RepID=UPI001CBDC30F|nr:DUF3703 domain-containing protein [Kangiella shandongensis]
MKTLKEKFKSELSLGKEYYIKQELNKAFYYLERAHILSQPHYGRHVLSHYWMLRVGIKRFDVKEVFGQMIRIIGSIGSLFGKYPLGNTGGANVSPFKPMPIPDDLKLYLMPSPRQE